MVAIACGLEPVSDNAVYGKLYCYGASLISIYNGPHQQRWEPYSGIIAGSKLSQLFRTSIGVCSQLMYDAFKTDPYAARTMSRFLMFQMH